MEKKIFPKEFIQAWKMQATKEAFVSELYPRHPKDCRNCGGIGTMVTFCAYQGPFDTPPVGSGIVAHFGAGKWWGGANISAKCPVCNGNGLNPEYKAGAPHVNPIRAKQAVESLGKMDTGQTEYIEDMESVA